MTKQWLAYDIGTSGAKAALMQGMSIQRAVTQSYNTHHGTGGVMEQHAGDWWRATVAATRDLMPPQQVDGIVLTGQMQDVVLLDETGDPVRPVILYSDTRAHTQMQTVVERVGQERLRELTGKNDNAGGLLAKLLWLQENEPASLDKAAHLLFGGADYTAACMTGRYRTDSTTASTTGLLDIHARTLLDAALFSDVGLSGVVERLPEVVSGGTQVGELTETAAQALGLKAGIPVYIAPGDAGAATIGANSGEMGGAYAYIGTSGWAGFTSNTVADPNSGVITLVHPKAGHFVQVAPMMTAGGNFDWITDVFNVKTDERTVSIAVAKTPTDLIYLPYLHGERAPFSDPFARSTFIGIDATTTRDDMVRAVLEGVAYALRHMLDALAPAGLSHLTLTGGGTRSVAWCQLFADVLKLPVQVAGDPENVGVRGAVRSVEVALGSVETYNLPEMPIRMTLVPHAAYERVYDKKYAIYREAYPALKSIFRKLHE